MITTGANSQGELEGIREAELKKSTARGERIKDITDGFAEVKNNAELGMYENIQSMAGEEWMRKQQAAMAPTFHEE